MCFTGKKIRAKSSKDGNLENVLKVEIIAIKGTMAVISTGATDCSGKCKQVKKNFWALWIWKNLLTRVSEQGAPVLWLSCEGQKDVWELFSRQFLFERHP